MSENMTLEQWTAALADGSAPKTISDMPRAMRECSDTKVRAAFLVAYRDAIKRDVPNECPYETLSSNIDYTASEWNLPMSWSNAVRLAFPKIERPLAENSLAYPNEWGRKITDTAAKMLRLAKKEGRQYHTVMNDHLFVANPDDTLDEVCSEFFIEGMISRFRYHARRRFGQAFADLGEKLFDLMGGRDG